ncbi:hypothetical protein [Balneatrix alpica]|uniref:hypothetical protein n=1 Tax=Balneatrix alpica TaxID=75684 RepID=UPI002738AE18|nr:hypothetical protein [Balneatrix alpica]
MRQSLRSLLTGGLLLCSLLTPNWAMAATQEVRIIPPQSQQDASHRYFQDLLQLSLDHSAASHGPAKVVLTDVVLQQGRAEKDVLHGDFIDVYWMGTSRERERDLRAIRIPLLKGLLGYRGLIIRSDRYRQFAQLNNAKAIQQLIACQGMHWPDSDILEANGYQVSRVARYESMFLMLSNGRCDYFPRGIHEGPAEVEAFNQQRVAGSASLMWFDQWLLYYPFPMYFFTSPGNEALAQRIEQGLNTLIDNGELTGFMQQHPISQHLFPLEQWQQRPIFPLHNPALPPDTQIGNSRYWLVPPGPH